MPASAKIEFSGFPNERTNQYCAIIPWFRISTWVSKFHIISRAIEVHGLLHFCLPVRTLPSCSPVHWTAGVVSGVTTGWIAEYIAAIIADVITGVIAGVITGVITGVLIRAWSNTVYTIQCKNSANLGIKHPFITWTPILNRICS